jgi:hypothetical protein
VSAPDSRSEAGPTSFVCWPASRNAHFCGRSDRTGQGATSRRLLLEVKRSPHSPTTAKTPPIASPAMSLGFSPSDQSWSQSSTSRAVGPERRLPSGSKPKVSPIKHAELCSSCDCHSSAFAHQWRAANVTIRRPTASSEQETLTGMRAAFHKCDAGSAIARQ